MLPVLVWLMSCKSYYATLTIENALPRKNELPNDIQSLTLMNRSMNNQFLNFKEDTLQKYFNQNGYQLSKIVLDSLVADTTIKALASLLFESGRYDVVVPLERNLHRDISYDLIPDTLSNQQVADICETFNTDALMVLERFYTKTMADYTFVKQMNPNTEINYAYYAALDVKYDAFFRIYKPGHPPYIKELKLDDTIYWESFENSKANLFSKLPSVKKAMINAGIKIALDVDSKISPYWLREKRRYFLFSKTNDKGQQLINENKYEEAGDYWVEMTKLKNKSIRSKAEFNLALLSELNGDIDAAIDWGLKSFHTQYRYQTENYLKKLQARRETINKK